MLRAAARELERVREQVNAHNVFPVADGDTGDNMALTLRSALRAVDSADPVDATALARAALLGARRGDDVAKANEAGIRHDGPCPRLLRWRSARPAGAGRPRLRPP